MTTEDLSALKGEEKVLGRCEKRKAYKLWELRQTRMPIVYLWKVKSFRFFQKKKGLQEIITT